MYNGFHTCSKGISPKVNTIAAVEHVNYYATGTPSEYHLKR